MPGGMAAAEVGANVDAMRVTPDNVLQIRNALLAESLVLREHLDQASQAAVVGKPGADEVSRRAAPAFNATITALFEECRAYVAACGQPRRLFWNPIATGEATMTRLGACEAVIDNLLSMRTRWRTLQQVPSDGADTWPSDRVRHPLP
jgi:hypothetical protein